MFTKKMNYNYDHPKEPFQFWDMSRGGDSAHRFIPKQQVNPDDFTSAEDYLEELAKHYSGMDFFMICMRINDELEDILMRFCALNEEEQEDMDDYIDDNKETDVFVQIPLDWEFNIDQSKHKYLTLATSVEQMMTNVTSLAEKIAVSDFTMKPDGEELFFLTFYFDDISSLDNLFP